MRQGQQQNRRGRGRNRKPHHNPLTRSFESNGPDVKIRGTPAHIAEKYISLARDATSSGDPVLAESYLQHAEHYNRIIMSVREQQMQQSGDTLNGAGGRPRPEGFEQGDDFGDDDGGDNNLEGLPQQAPTDRSPEGQQGGFEGQPREDRGQRDRGFDQNRRPHRDRFNNDYRGYNRDRSERDRSERDRPERPDRSERLADPGASDQPQVGPRPEGGPRRRERFGEAPQQHEQPEFLRRSVRRPRGDQDAAAEGNDGPEPAGKDKTPVD